MSRDDKFTFVYDKANNKPTIVATGAIGGPTPNGSMIIAHLFLEYGSVPALATYPIVDSNRLDLSSEEADLVQRGNATRDIQATLALSPQNALVIGEWLIKHAQGILGGSGDVNK
ncbi:MAG: hypothetical protein AAF564_17875 [Bacteroidota bacterium]